MVATFAPAWDRTSAATRLWVVVCFASKLCVFCWARFYLWTTEPELNVTQLRDRGVLLSDRGTVTGATSALGTDDNYTNLTAHSIPQRRPCEAYKHHVQYKYCNLNYSVSAPRVPP